ncbi:MAG TPA: ferrochelatase [Opitutaceae bacterium]|nr:ferrochelatase [Opitutaceae bacterium]
MAQRAVLLVNLGSPDSTSVADVRTYLREFLGDERVIDKPGQPFRSILVNQIITPRRAPNSAHAYSTIWTEQGSPLIVISKSVQQKLSAKLGADTPVYLAMRYRVPSIASVIDQIVADGVTEILLFPQYPHYAMSSWETVVVEVYKQAERHGKKLRIVCEQPFFDNTDYIEALYQSAKPYIEKPHDLLLFSYHGIPARHLRKADSSHAHCLTVDDCCNTCSPVQSTCYRSQVFKTTQAFVKRAGIAKEKHHLSFQSRLAGEPWLTPYTDFELVRLPKAGIKNLVVMTPAFVSDCLETLEEIRVQGRDSFLKAGGETFQHVPCLNDHPAYIDFLAGRVNAWLNGEKPNDRQARLHMSAY